MKKILLCTAALAMFAGSIATLEGNKASADINPGDANNSENTTGTFFKISNSSNATTPYNPDNPGQKGNDDTNNKYNIKNTHATGNLTLDAVPSDLHFGTVGGADAQSISVKPKNDKNDADLKDSDTYNNFPFTQVSDYRDGEKGWTLTASMSDMNDTNHKHILNDAQITFKSNKDKASPAYENYTKNNISDAPNIAQSFTLNPNRGSINIMTAPQGKGKLTWVDPFNDINLNAGASADGTYQGSITWFLTSNVGDNGVGQQYNSQNTTSTSANSNSQATNSNNATENNK